MVDQGVNAAAIAENQDSSLNAGCDKGELSGMERGRSHGLVTEQDTAGDGRSQG